jgi:long-chain acyl-CoA synthetase
MSVAQTIHPAPWRVAFPTAADWDAELPVSTIPVLLDRAAAAYPDRTVIDFRGAKINYRALSLAADGLAAGLIAQGIGKGDTIAVYLHNTPWHPVCFFGVTRTGARVVHLSVLDAPRELAYKIKDSGARILITTNLPGLLPTALALLEQGAVERVLIGEDVAWGAGPAAPLPVDYTSRVQKLPTAPVPTAWPDIDLDDVCALQYTGGTTGMPKGAMLSHRNITAAVAQGQASTDGAEAPAGGDRIIGVLPLFHIYGLTVVLLRTIADGSELLLRERFDVLTTLDDVGRLRATVLYGVPTIWIALLNHPASKTTDFSSLRAAFSGGAPMPFEVEQQVGRMIGQRLGGGWGMTETSPGGTRIPVGMAPIPGLIGIPMPGIDMQVVDRTDPSRVLPPGEVGELAIKGPNVFAGSWNRPEETKAAFHHGYFLTGDIGTMDERGLFRILDRKKNMLICGGFNVYPAMIEAAIYEHPSVAEVIVIGIADAYRGQSPKAFITLRQGAAPLTLEALQSFLSDRLGRHEIPTAMELRESLPRSPAGKLLAKVLVEEEARK